MMNLKNTSQNITTELIKSVLAGAGFTVIFLILGLVLDYVVTQLLSQYFIRDCSEDCYFKLFNIIFVGVVILSLAGGIRTAMRAYKRSNRKE